MSKPVCRKYAPERGQSYPRSACLKCGWRVTENSINDMCIEDKTHYEEVYPEEIWHGDQLGVLTMLLLRRLGGFATIKVEELEEVEKAKVGVSLNSDESIRLRLVKDD